MNTFSKAIYLCSIIFVSISWYQLHLSAPVIFKNIVSKVFFYRT